MKKIILSLAALCGFFIAQNAQATCSNYTTYADGQVLTAGSLNSLQTNYTNCVNDVLNGDTFTGNLNLHSGADLSVYSDTGTTLKAHIDGTTGDVILSPRTHGTAVNCEINYSAGTVTISGRGGAALAASNPCHIGIRSNSNGVVTTATFTSNITATDGATSQTDSNLFGITDANWSSAMPMFFGVVYNGTTPYFTLSRVPAVTTGPAATDICQLGDTDCDAQSDVMILTTGLTLASWVDLPITQVAWLQGTYATSGGAWTFAETPYTGFNNLWMARKFSMPVAQMGGSAGYMADNAGTGPVFSDNEYTYWWVSQNHVCTNVYLNGDGGTDGAGAVSAQLAIPYLFPSGTMTTIYPGAGRVNGATTITGVQAISGRILENTSLWEPYYFDASAVITAVTNAMFSNGARYILTGFCYTPVTN